MRENNNAAGTVANREPVDVIGLGFVGSALAELLLQCGCAVVGCDIDAAKNTALREEGGEEADNPAAMDVKGQRMLDGDFTPASRVRQHLKDVEMILDHARQTGQELPLGAVHERLLRDAVTAGDGDMDNVAIILEIRRRTITPPYEGTKRRRASHE